MRFDGGSMGVRWSDAHSRTATVSASCRTRVAWLISGLFHAYYSGKTPWSRSLIYYHHADRPPIL